MNENVSDRTPDVPVQLPEVAADLLQEARGAEHGHAALTLTPTRGGPLKQTLVAVCAGGSLDPMHWNGPTSLQTITGRAHIDGHDAAVEPGAWTVISDGDGISADSDLVVLLTVSPDAD